MKLLSKKEEIQKILNKFPKENPLWGMIMMQMNRLSEYPWIIVKKNDKQLELERGELKDKNLIHGISIRFDENKIICQLVDIDSNKKMRRFSNVTYIYTKCLGMGGEHFYNGILETRYQQIREDGTPYVAREQSYFKKKQNEYGRIVEKDNGHTIISIRNNIVLRAECNNEGTGYEYFMYELSNKEMWARKFGHQFLPYPIEPIDEQTYINIQNGTYFKQKSL